jgi:hypothetical protein
MQLGRETFTMSNIVESIAFPKAAKLISKRMKHRLGCFL